MSQNGRNWQEKQNFLAPRPIKNRNTGAWDSKCDCPADLEARINGILQYLSVNPYAGPRITHLKG